jgi:hypothetical protein
MNRWFVAILLALGLLIGTFAVTSAQFSALLNGGRLAARNGRWLTPVAASLLASDEEDHLARNSVWAWDLAMPFGTPVYPMAGGKVIYAGCNNAGGYGCWAMVDHEDGFASLYAHMIDEGGGGIWVHSGDRVTQWTPLGRVGWTGRTSFGPHVHWEIHRHVGGRVRLDAYFDRNSIPYCKFCAASSIGQGGLSDVVAMQQPPLFASFFQRPEVWGGLLFLILVISALIKPDFTVQTTRGIGAFLLGTMRASQHTVKNFRRNNVWIGAGAIFSFVMPLALCSSLLALQIWMVDQGVSYNDLLTYFHYGFYPYVGSGYASGSKYSAVWGSPCQSVGTLGRVCSASEIVSLGLKWQRDVDSFTGQQPTFVVIPRLSRQFGIAQVRSLIYETHQAKGLVIVDVAADIDKAQSTIDDLVNVGLDGIAFDMEFMQNVTAQQIKDLAHYLSVRRAAAGIKGEGVLVVWNVFHNIDKGGDLSVEGVKVVPIFTGYGTSATKVAGLSATQRLFSVTPADSGLMAFDQRWPVNFACKGFGLTQGFDCQSWYALFSDPTARQVGWWVQQ